MMLKAILAWTAAGFFAAAGAESPELPALDGLRLNEIKVIGTHNSYHVRPSGGVGRLIMENVGRAQGWDYTHAPLDKQLERGVRNFELDLHGFATGFEVLHVPIYDPGTTCPRFMDCLETVAAWSERNPGHVPVSFLLEIKYRETALDPRESIAWDRADLERLESEILAVFPRERLIVPDDVRGGAATLRDAVQAGEAWPKVEDARGKMLFILHNRTGIRERYLEGNPNLEGRVMFVNSAPGDSFAATIVADNPRDSRVADLARSGFLVRTRADSGLREARAGDTRRRDAAFASGAHIISTDYPPGQPHEETGYIVAFPEGAAARPNPVTAPEAAR